MRLFIAAMTATSFNRTVAWLGARRWRLLNLVGGWYVWVSFAVAVGKRVAPGAGLLGDDGAGDRGRAIAWLVAMSRSRGVLGTS